MHSAAVRKWALALTFWLALHVSSLKAQIFSNDLPLQAVTTGSDPVDFEFRSDGTLIAKGNLGVGSLLSTDQGDGTRMLWFPSLGAFRAGTVSTGLSIGDGPWDVGRIGNNSVAFGYNNTAIGADSVALGFNSNAYGSNSFVFGYCSTAGTDASIAMGGFDYAASANAVALGSNNSATGFCAMSFGHGTIASGPSSTASGAYTTASGYGATALGGGTSASGTCATSTGECTTATAEISFVVGVYNVGLNSSGGAASPTSWVPTDPLFEVGNGGSSASGYGNPAATGPSDALVVYKNGNAAVQGNLDAGGVITASAGGDIPMYTGN